jgi:branched-subunit amino acid ABC-type transport system permease component
VSPAKAQVALFALSAGIAGFGGAMYGLTAFSITATSIPPFLGLIWLAVAVTFGIRRPGGALLAGLAFTAAPVIWQNLAKFSWMPHFLSELIISPYFTPMLFGLGAINLAKNPDGLALVGHDRLAKAGEGARPASPRPSPSCTQRGRPEVAAVTEGVSSTS